VEGIGVGQRENYSAIGSPAIPDNDSGKLGGVMLRDRNRTMGGMKKSPSIT
jgi:hypothetical protein